jgi:hypothetical protein
MTGVLMLMKNVREKSRHWRKLNPAILFPAGNTAQRKIIN